MRRPFILSILDGRATIFLMVVIGIAVLVPILNLITPVFATALMVRVHKRLSPTRELIEPAGR